MRSAFTPRRKPARRFSVVTMVLAVLALGFVLLVGLRSALATSAGPVLGLAPSPGTGSMSHGPAGVPAIQPQAALAQAGGAGPYFTEADVRQYLAAHPPYFTAPGAPNPVVVSVQFLTSIQASAQLGGEQVAADDSTLVCLVYLTGSFQNMMTIPPGAPAAPAPTFTDGWMAFDAHTGNLILTVV